MSTSVPTNVANPFQASSSKIHPPSDSQQPQHPQLLELAIFTPFVGLDTEPPPAITTDALAQYAMSTTEPSDEPGITRLLSGPLADFELYSGQERSQWLLDIAHDICDPLCKRGSLIVWNEAERRYRDVIPADALIPSLYAYFLPPSTVVALTKISGRVGRSRTDATGNASTMADRVKGRDGRCWVSGGEYPLVNSHVCPKRMGDHLLRIVYNNFVQTPPPPTLSIYDEICGITLTKNLDAWFDEYELGLRLVSEYPVRNSSFLLFYI